MQVGAIFPQTEIGADPADIRMYATSVQDMGYRHLLVYDHVVGADPLGHPNFAGPYTVKTMFHEPMVLFGYLAAVSPLLELVTGVIILPQRQTTLVAKQAAEVDILTEGKFRLGIGIGWNAVEYEALGMDFSNRGRRLEEQIEVMRRLWQDPVVTFEGQFHHITAAGLNPLPVQRPIPIWIGGSAEAAIKRAAEKADGFFPQVESGQDWTHTLNRMREWREAAGRPWAGFGIEARLNASIGDAAAWRKSAEVWGSRGATHISVNTMGGGLVGVEQHVERLLEVRDAIQAVTA